MTRDGPVNRRASCGRAANRARYCRRMSTPARECSRRAADWAANDALVRAAVVFGSVARGQDDEYSDLDLILVAVDGAGQDLWQRRREVAASVLGDDVVTTQQPAWQGERRFQAWTID